MVALIINEIFESIQGEGSYAGRPCFFVRLQGCSVGCYFCDEKKTWSAKGGIEMTAAEIVMRLRELNPQLKHVTISGGEPCEQDLSELLDMLEAEGYSVAIETSGVGDYAYVIARSVAKCEDDNSSLRAHEVGEAIPMPLRRDLWITLSPKEIYSARARASGSRDLSISDEIWELASEIKFVISGEQAADYLREVILPRAAGRAVYLVPDWFDFDANKKLVIELCRNYPSQVRLGLQGHKYLEIA